MSTNFLVIDAHHVLQEHDIGNIEAEHQAFRVAQESFPTSNRSPHCQLGLNSAPTKRNPRTGTLKVKLQLIESLFKFAAQEKVTDYN